MHACAKFLKGSLPALSDRANHMRPTLQSRRLANVAFGETLSWLAQERLKDGGCTSEALALYLMSREGMTGDDFLWPGSFREGNSNYRRLNHDSYTLWPGKAGIVKFPLELKTGDAEEKNYDVPTLALRTTLRPVLQMLGRQSLYPLMVMAGREATEGVGFYEETVLDYAGHCLQSAITNHVYNRILTATHPPSIQSQ